MDDNQITIAFCTLNTVRNKPCKHQGKSAKYKKLPQCMLEKCNYEPVE